MKRTFLLKYPYYLTLTSIFATAVMMVYSAQPWGDNYAYVEFYDYTLLFLFISWAVMPYFPLIFIFRKPSSYRANRIVRRVGISLICIPSLALIADTVFIHIDAQGSLIFVFLPIYQWIAVVIFILVNASIEYKLNKKRQAAPS